MSISSQDVSRELLLIVNSEGVIIDISKNCITILGYTAEELARARLSDLLKNEIDLSLIDTSSNVELAFTDRGGRVIYFDALICKNQTDEFVLSLLNIRKYKEIELWEQRFRNLLENTTDIVYLYEILPEAKYAYINHALEQELGYTVEEAYHNSKLPFEVVHPEDLPIQYMKLNKTTDFSKPMQARIRKKNGEYVWLEENVVPLFNCNGELEAISGFCRNIQARKEKEFKLREVSYRDSLTGLYSYNYFHLQEKRLDTEKDRSVGIIMCDLDNLKMVNDSLGHPYGDKLIINFADLLKKFCSDHTNLIRTGGDEFVILLEDVERRFVKHLYHRLQESLEEYNETNEQLPIKVSLGWAHADSSLGRMKEVYKKADDMMYKNKLHRRCLDRMS